MSTQNPQVRLGSSNFHYLTLAALKNSNVSRMPTALIRTRVVEGTICTSSRRILLIKSERNPAILGPMNREKLVEEMQKNIYYSEKYYDDEFEYRHVVLPREMLKLVPKTHLMSEQEWRSIGVQQSKGWIHYMTHTPEPHILLFRRPTTIPQ